MVEAIACNIREIVLSSGYVNTHFEWCELVREGNVTYPAQYIGGGNYVQVLNNDVNGNSYLRKNGNVSFGKPPGKGALKLTSCSGDTMVQMTIPLRLVMVVPKDKLADDAFSDDLLVQDMTSLIQGSVDLPETGAHSIKYQVTGSDTDSLSIWSQEVKGAEYQMLFKYSYIAINFNAVAVLNPNCLYRTCAYYS